MNALLTSESDSSPINISSDIPKRSGVQHHHQQSKWHWLSVNYRLKPSHTHLRRYEKLVNGRKTFSYVMVSVLSPNKLTLPSGRRINSATSSSLFIFPLLEFSACLLGTTLRLQSEEPALLYSSPKHVRLINQRRMRRDGHLALVGEKLNTHTAFVQHSKRKMPLGRPRTRWKYYIKNNLEEIRWKMGTDFV